MPIRARSFGPPLALLVVLLVPAPVTPAQDAAPAAAVSFHVSDIHDEADAAIADAPLAIMIAAPRRGTASAKVVAASTAAISGLSATASDLRQGDTVIPASQIAVRYGVLWDQTIGSSRRPRGDDILLDSPPAEAPANTPVWLTVDVPADARPGPYMGELKLSAAGARPVAVPVTLDVIDYTLPDTQDYRAWIELMQSPDTLALEYGLPLWSDKHLAMISRSFDYIGKVGSRVVYLPLICNMNLGNTESMVRWVRKGENQYEFDFAPLDRYLDAAVAHMGKPRLVVIGAWEIYLRPPDSEPVITEEDSSYQKGEKEKWIARWQMRDKGPAVTVIDPATGKTEAVYLPNYTDPAAKTLWQPLWTQLRERLQKRGLLDVAVLGVISDWQPSKEETAVLAELSGNMPWTSCSHHANWLFRSEKRPEKPLYGMAGIRYATVALDYQYTLNPSKGRIYGWKDPVLHAQYWRFSTFNTSQPNFVRYETEAQITGNKRGIGHLGADYWFATRSKRGQRVSVVGDRFPESYWHSLNTYGWMLAPGPDGPVGTARYEYFRQGVKACEARILIESALTDDALRAKLGDDLAARAQKVLDDRLTAIWKSRGAADEDLAAAGVMTYYRDIDAMIKKWNSKAGQQWFLKSDWHGRDALLYTVAGEVQRKLAD